ncbi:MAG: TrbC/VirB2 family protein [Sedimentibacter sp.]
METNKVAVTKAKTVKNSIKYITALVLSYVFMANTAFALHGGFSTAQTDTSNVQKWLYGVVGVVGIAYLSFIGLKIKAQKATWQDFGIGVIYVAVAGAAVTAGPYAYKMFS